MESMGSVVASPSFSSSSRMRESTGSMEAEGFITDSSSGGDELLVASGSLLIEEVECFASVFLVGVFGPL